jgi:uncharacterized small protein (DUF1192 family)
MSEGISYQAKDILFKSLSELYRNQALEVYGLTNLPKIKELLPSQYPSVQADEKRSDTLFLLEDGSILMLEYESNNRFIENHLKYLDYAQRILHRYYKEQKEIKHIRIVVIYTSDVTNVKEILDAGDVRISSKAVLLCEYNGDAILHAIEEKIHANEELTHGEMMKLILVPLMYSREDRQTMIEKTINVVKQIKNEQKQLHIIAGILTATDKFIDEEYAKRIREWLKMTKVAQIFEQEKKKAVKEAEKHKAFEIAKNLLDVLSIDEIAKRTGLAVAEVEELAKGKK